MNRNILETEEFTLELGPGPYGRGIDVDLRVDGELMCCCQCNPKNPGSIIRAAKKCIRELAATMAATMLAEEL